MEINNSTEQKLMQKVPDSYSDFVDCMCRWMKRDSKIRSLILEQLRVKPDSDTQDLMRILWGYLGIGEAVELVDEDEYESGFEEVCAPASGVNVNVRVGLSQIA